MTLRYVDLGVVGTPCLLVLNDGVPYGIQTSEGLSLMSAAAAVTSVVGTANQITANTVANVVTLTLPAVVLAPGSLGATTRVNAPSFLKASLPAVGAAGGVIYVSDATGLHVTGSLAFSNGTSWIDVTTGIAVV